MSQGKPSDVEIDDYCQAWISNGNKQADAWRVAYPNSQVSGKGAQEKASKMHKMGKVQARIADLTVKAAEIAEETHGVTVNSLLNELEEARELGKANAQTSACVAATMGKAKLCGLDVQKLEVAGPGGRPIQTISAAIDPVSAGKAYEDMIKG